MAKLLLGHVAKLSKIKQMWHLQMICSKFAIEVNPFFRPVILTDKNLGSLVQISKGYDSHLDERGRVKAKKRANIAIYRLFDRMCVSFGVAIICLCKPF